MDLPKLKEDLQKAQDNLQALQGASSENANLKKKISQMEEAAAKAQENFRATLQAEQDRLVAEMAADNEAMMKIAWDALNPGKDYGVWALAHKYADEVVYLRERGEPEPESFLAWAETEQPEPETPEAPDVEILEEGERNQEGPPAGQ